MGGTANGDSYIYPKKLLYYFYRVSRWNLWLESFEVLHIYPHYVLVYDARNVRVGIGGLVNTVKVNVSVFGQGGEAVLKEVFGYIRDILKSPKLVTWIAVSSAVILYLPEKYAPKPFLFNFRLTYGAYVSVALIAATVFLLIEVVVGLFRNAQMSRREGEVTTRLFSRLQALTYEEQLIMREFIFQASNNIKLPIPQRVVATLARDGLILLVQRLSENCPAGSVGVFRIAPLIEEALCEPLVGLPVEKVSEEEKVAFFNQRPSFIRQITERERIWEW